MINDSEVVISSVSSAAGLSFWSPLSQASLFSAKQTTTNHKGLATCSRFFATINANSSIVYLFNYGRSSPAFKSVLDVIPLCIDISTDGTILVVGCSDGSIRLWDVSTGNLLSNSRLLFTPIVSIALSSCSSYLVIGGEDSSILVFTLSSLFVAISSPDPSTPSPFSSFSCFSASISDLVFSPVCTPPRLYASSIDGSFRVLTPFGEDLFATAFNSGVVSIAVDLLESVVAVGTLNGSIWILNTLNLSHCLSSMKQLSGHSGAVTALSFSESTRKLFSSSADGSIKVWDVDAGQCISTINLTGTGGCLRVVPLPPQIMDKRHDNSNIFPLAPLKRVLTTSLSFVVRREDKQTSSVQLNNLTASLLDGLSTASVSTGSTKLLQEETDWQAEAMKYKMMANQLLKSLAEQ
ncbi:hypothetical protein RCL1_004476 [Eukaryota sp. TZLM3-RCL]